MRQAVICVPAIMQEVPAVNAVIEEDEIVFRDYYDISIAVATPKVGRGRRLPVLPGGGVCISSVRVG